MGFVLSSPTLTNTRQYKKLIVVIVLIARVYDHGLLGATPRSRAGPPSFSLRPAFGSRLALSLSLRLALARLGRANFSLGLEPA